MPKNQRPALDGLLAVCVLIVLSTVVSSNLFPVLGVAPVRATTLAPEILIHADPPDRELKPGQEFVIPVKVYVREDLTLERLTMSADLVSAAPQLAPMSAANKADKPDAVPGYRIEYREIRGVMREGLDELMIRAEAGNTNFEDTLHLASLGGLQTETVVEQSKSITGYRFDPDRFERPEPVGTDNPVAEPSSYKAPRDVRVHGRILAAVPSAGIVGVDGATVILMQQRDILDDIQVAMATTDVNGDFDFTGSVDGAQNLYVKVRAINSYANIGTDVGFQTYGRNTTVWRNFTGTEIALGGTRWTGRMNEALYMLGTLTRARRWYMYNGQFLPRVNCRFPDDVLGSSCYLPIWEMEGIHLRSEDRWDSRTLVHEYGHHFIYASPATEVWPPHYINGVCDPSHCGWCRENEAVAWSEGFPYFLTGLINNDHVTDYGWTTPGGDALFTYESHSNCRETDALDTNPQSTELFFSAFLNDLIDPSPDDSDLDPGLIEHSQLPLHDILNVATWRRPSDSLAFTREMRDYLQDHPVYGATEIQEFWVAARINGFEADDVPPTPPTTVTSSTHTLWVASSSNMPQLDFAGATDDDSGVYSHYVTMDPGPGYPGGGGETFLLTEDMQWPTPLAEGAWYANVVSVDRAGNQSTTQYSFGPMVVGPPDPLDLAPVTDYLWDAELVLRHDANVTATEAYLPSELVGGQPLWISFFARNISVSGANVDTFTTRLHVNGSTWNPPPTYPADVMAAGEDFQVLNYHVAPIVGGRHRIYARIDSGGDVAELDETNNVFGQQLVFRPLPLAPGAWHAQPKGVHPTAGDRFLSSPYPNTTGVRVVPTNSFAVVTLKGNAHNTDYTMNLHEASTGYGVGFDTVLASSDGTGDEHDALLINIQAHGVGAFDIGTVVEYDNHVDSGFQMRHFNSKSLVPGDSTSESWGDEDHYTVYQLYFNIFELGPFQVSIDADFTPGESQPELELFWVDRSQNSFDLTSTVPDAVTDSDGLANLQVDIGTSGTYALVVRREASFSGTHLPLDFDIETTTVPQPDFEFLRDNAFWDAPMLPSFEPIPGPKLNLPADLIGEGLFTYLNFGVRNSSLVDVDMIPLEITMDGAGQAFFYHEFDETMAGEAQEHYGSNPIWMNGGRHTLVAVIDPWNVVPESNELNNTYGTQFGWSGPEMNIGGTLTRAAPPDPDAGLDAVQMELGENFGPTGETGTTTPLTHLAPNCDGVRLPEILPKQGGNWVGIATMPGDTSDVDLRLHELTTPAAAFVTPIVESTWSGSESDFVVVNHHETPTRPFDVGVVNAGGQQLYTLHTAQSFDKGTAADLGIYGPFQVEANGILTLIEFHLDPGDYSVDLTGSQVTDLGIMLMGPAPILGEPYHSKNDALNGAPAAWLNPAGQPEKLVFSVEHGDEGSYCFAVFKVSPADLPFNDEFSLEFSYTPSAPPHILIDGVADNNYGYAYAVQSVGTDFGDSDLGQIDTANGSELDLVVAKIHEGVLYLMLGGNLESNYNDLEIFLDTRPGGQNQLRGDNAIVDEDGLNGMGANDWQYGFKFDSGFVPDYWFSASGGTFALGTSLPVHYKFSVYWAELLDEGGGPGGFLGSTDAGSNGRLIGESAVNPHGVRATIDNRNTGGVGAGTGPDSGAYVNQGMEFAIPLAAIGNPTDCIRILAFINGQRHDYVSNQFMPPLPVGTGNLGDPGWVDLSTLPGNQYFEVCPLGVTGVDEHLPSRLVDGALLAAPYPNPFNPRTTISFSLAEAREVWIEVYDVAGRKVDTVVGGQSLPAGNHERVWEARDARGRQVASGTYLVRMRAGAYTGVQRLTLLK